MGCDCHTNTGCYPQAYALTHLWATLLNASTQLIGQTQSALGVGIRQKHHKLLATHTAYKIAIAYPAPQDTGNGLQNCITSIMPIMIIDSLEMIQVDEQHGV